MNEIFYTKRLSKELWKDFEAYFEYQGNCSGCWCMNHRMPMGLDVTGEAAKLSMKQLIETERVFGILAYVEKDSVPIGWASLDPKKSLPGLDCFDIGQVEGRVWSIHCISTRSDYSNTDIKETMIEAVIDYVKDLNGEFIEAYPEPASKMSSPYKTWNTFNGYQEMFENLDFKLSEKVPADLSSYYAPMLLDLKDSK